MEWKNIIVGVDGSPESVRAATVGSALAARARARCRLVHAAPDYWAAVATPELGLDREELERATVEHARSLLEAALRGHVAPALLADLEIAVGRAPSVLGQAASRLGADLLVLGGKHHRGLDRVTSSTIVHMVRAHDVPVLATDGGAPEPRRILAAVDLSHAAPGVIAAAEYWAMLFGAHLRVLSVVEPMPVVPGVSLRVTDNEVYHASEQLLELEIWPQIRRTDAETVVRRGRAAAAIADEAAQWQADLLVVGSHGKGWVDRLLIGSTSERLLHVLPATMLIVPVAKPAPDRPLDLVTTGSARAVVPARGGA
jgi:nucleotide-binding universal stress UspA family protein